MALGFVVSIAASLRDDRREDFVIIARTDARGAADGSLTEAIERVNAYCEAGADVAFVEGPTDEHEVERVGREIDAPLLSNCLGAAGTSPVLDPSRLQELGYDIVLYPLAATQATLVSAFEQLQRLNDDETEATDELDAAVESLPISDLHDFSGFPDVVAFEEEYMPDVETEKYDDSAGIDVRDE